MVTTCWSLSSAEAPSCCARRQLPLREGAAFGRLAGDRVGGLVAHKALPLHATTAVLPSNPGAFGPAVVLYVPKVNLIASILLAASLRGASWLRRAEAFWWILSHRGMKPPQCIVCRTEETIGTLYLLGGRICGGVLFEALRSPMALNSLAQPFK